MSNGSYKNSLDITGQKFNYLLAIEKTSLRRGKHVVWKFLCDCGNAHYSTATDVKRGDAKSCGCKKSGMVSQAKTTHGATQNYKPTPTYMIWSAMKKRCLNPRSKFFADYGGRGIQVCERWLKFENFLEDMGEAPIGMSIDRIDNDLNYEPSNCRWATAKEQGNNRRTTVLLTIDGETKSMTEWSRISGIHQATLWHRINIGMDPKSAVFTPPMPRKDRRRRR